MILSLIDFFSLFVSIFQSSEASRINNFEFLGPLTDLLLYVIAQVIQHIGIKHSLQNIQQLCERKWLSCINESYK